MMQPAAKKKKKNILFLNATAELALPSHFAKPIHSMPSHQFKK